jgi:hypothetical protein
MSENPHRLGAAGPLGGRRRGGSGMEKLEQSLAVEATSNHRELVFDGGSTKYIYIFTTKGNLVRKLPSYGRLSWLAFPPSCQPHRHINYPSSSS